VLAVDLELGQAFESPGQVAEAEQGGDRRDLAPAAAALFCAVGVHHPRPDHGGDRLILEGRDQGLDTAVLQVGVGIEEDDVFAPRGLGPHVGAAREADIAVSLLQDDPRLATPQGAQPFGLVGRRAVVDDHELVDQRLGQHVLDAFDQGFSVW
jgi:hypothetical protein